MIEGACPFPREFIRQRKSIHNLLAYRRGQSSWWGGVGVWLWSAQCGLYGVVELGAVGTEEFNTAFQQHGIASLRPIGANDVRVEVYKAAQMVSLEGGLLRAGRYQSVRIAVAPTSVVMPSVCIIDRVSVEPLPMLF